MGLFNKDFNNDFKKTMMGDDIRKLVAAKIAGQGNQVDVGSVLPDIFYRILDLIDFVRGKIPTVPTALETLASLTCISTAETIESAEGISKQEAADALGIIPDHLDSLFDGSYIRFEVAGVKLNIDSVSEGNVSIGGGTIVISLSEGEYTIVVGS